MTLRLLLLLVALAVLAILAVPSSAPTSGLQAEGPDGFHNLSCASYNDEQVYLSKPPPVTGAFYFTGMDLEIAAVAQVFRGVRIENTEVCDVLYQVVPDFEWELAKPNGSASTVANESTLTIGLELDVSGEYTLVFTACPNRCRFEFEGIEPFYVDPIERQVTLNAVDELAFPPRMAPILPDLNQFCDPDASTDPCKPTFFSDTGLDFVCAGGGGVVDPQWVTTTHWSGPDDYRLVEGVVERARVSRVDTAWNHHSQDVNLAVTVDPQYRYLLARHPEWPDQPYRLGVEWEEGEYPERFRPTTGDRVSVFGYWIHDCGHEPFYTEIHPPVGIATHRARPIAIPASEGLGSNVYAPGISTDIWFNEDSGEITDNCSDTGLHQPGSGHHQDLNDYCIPEPETGGNSPLDRAYTFNIYLPPNPEDILRENDHPNPPEVGLYLDVDGSGGPDPEIEVITNEEGITYLEVTIDLSASASISEYSRRIEAAWKYPSPDNWGLKRYRFRLNNLDVADDADPTRFGWSGDWNLWMNLQNTTQEWTRILDCSNCVEDWSYVRFGGRPWETESQDDDRDLGPHLMLYPEQTVWLHMSGYEEDGAESDDDIGSINQLHPQPPLATSYRNNNYCTSQGTEIAGIGVQGSFCGYYAANYQILPLGGVLAELSDEGRALYEASFINAGDQLGCLRDFVAVRLCVNEQAPILDIYWHPNSDHPTEPKPLHDTPVFRRQPREALAITEVDAVTLADILRTAPESRVDKMLSEFREELPSIQDDHVGWEFLLLEAALPPGKFQEHLGDVEFRRPVWGDLDCDDDVDEQDAVWGLRAAADVSGAPCFVQGDTECDGDHDALDVLAILLFKMGEELVASSSDDCWALGEEVHLSIEVPEPTATPTVSPTPPVSPTGTPVITPTPTATPTVTPSPSPVPSPDTTGPSISSITESADPVWDEPGCGAETSTTIGASISDPSGISNVRFFYRIVVGLSEPGSFTGVTPSFNAETGKYQRTINPPTMNVDGQIQWYWRATDGAGNVSRVPADAPAHWRTTTVRTCHGGVD